MKVLAIDHHSSYDLASLVFADKGRSEVRTLSAEYFGWEARRFFPDQAWNGLRAYHRPEYARARESWRARAREIVHELYMVFPFDVIICPADTFFYIRDFRWAAGDLGVPFIVVLKETTVPPIQMEREAPELKELFPFISDFLCLCSERAKAFWLIAGAPEGKIEVTGQPRFDFYRQPERWRSWDELGYPIEAGTRTALFLSYDPGIFQLESDYLSGRTPWLRMREETEEVLVQVAREGGCTLLIKPHPQQPPDDVGRMVKRLRDLGGEAWGRRLFLVDAGADVRPCVVAADVIIGFQTTTLMEAMIAGKKTIYTQWGELRSTRDLGLIPYDQYGDILIIAESAAALRAAVLDRGPFDCVHEMMRRRVELFESYLGPLDGHSAERVWRAIERTYRSGPRLGKQPLILREELGRRRRWYLWREATRAAVWAGAWIVARETARALPNETARHYSERLGRRFRRQRDRFHECLSSLRGYPEARGLLVGAVDEGFGRQMLRLWRGVRRRNRGSVLRRSL